MLPAERAPSASALLDTYWDGYLPVKVKLIAETQGIEVHEVFGLGSASGCIVRHDDGRVDIQVNSEDSQIRQRFTIAHELGHYNLGHLEGSKRMFRDDSTVFNSGERAPEEVAANEFAARLLMPAKAIQFVLESGKAKTLGELARLFAVSTAAMGYRMKNLGYAVG